MPLFTPGSQLSALPQAPSADPRLFAADPQAALATAQIGLLVGKELAGLQNQQARLDLEKAEIAAKKAQNEFQRQMTDHALLNIGAFQSNLVEGTLASIAETRARAAAQQNLLAEQQALASENVPALSALARGAALNKDISASATESLKQYAEARRLEKAAQGPGGWGEAANVVAQGEAYARAAGGSLIKPGADGLIKAKRTDGTEVSVPPPFFKTTQMPIHDAQTGTDKNVTFWYDARNPGELHRLTEVVQGPSAGAEKLLPEAAALKSVQDAIANVRRLSAGVDPGLYQVLATSLASSKGAGVWTDIKRVAGKAAQDPKVQELGIALDALSTQLGSTGLFGATEGERATKLPSASDLGNMQALSAKLDAAERMIQSKLTAMPAGTAQRIPPGTAAAPSADSRLALWIARADPAHKNPSQAARELASGFPTKIGTNTYVLKQIAPGQYQLVQVPGK